MRLVGFTKRMSNLKVNCQTRNCRNGSSYEKRTRDAIKYIGGIIRAYTSLASLSARSKYMKADIVWKP